MHNRPFSFIPWHDLTSDTTLGTSGNCKMLPEKEEEDNPLGSLASVTKGLAIDASEVG